MYHPFSITQTLNIAWKVLKKNLAIILVYNLIGIFIIALTFFLVSLILLNTYLEVFSILVVFATISCVFLGFIKLVFQLIDKEYYDFEFRDILPKPKMVFNYVLLLIIISTPIVFINKALNHLDSGIIQNSLKIITDLIFQIFFIFYLPICSCFIVDDNSGFFECIRQTNQLIKGNFIKYALLLVIIIAIIAILYLLIFGILLFVPIEDIYKYLVKYSFYLGVIFILPVVNILMAVTYRKLIYSHLDVDDDVTETV